MDKTTLIEFNKPAGNEPYSRAILNGNFDIADKQFIVLALCTAVYGAITKGAIVFDENGNPQSQSISGENGLAGSIIWSFTSTTITETLSITAPTAFSVTKTITLEDFSEEWVVN